MPRSATSKQTGGAFASLRLQIEYVPIDSLRPGENVTRDHSRQQLRRIARSIKDFGFLVPVVVYGDNILATGLARIAAAKLAGLTEVPVVRRHGLSDEQMRLFAIADNKLTEGGSWNFDALRAEFASISVLAPKLDQNMSGFAIAERDIIWGRDRAARLADDDEIPSPDSRPPVSRLGDCFRLNRHLLLCGDATDAATMKNLLGTSPVRTVASDLPYNVKIGGNVSGLGRKKHEEFAMASGEMSKQEFIDFLINSLSAFQPFLTDGALLYLFMDWRHLHELISASEALQLSFLNLLVWAKTNAGMGSLYRSAHELIGLFKHGSAAHTNNIELGRHGRNRTNVLHYPGVNTFSKGRSKALESHPTVKPTALMADLILDSSGPDEIVLDPFGGSGTTLIAAEKVDRVARLVEINPAYVDVTIRRFEALTGESATLVSTGQTFAELEQKREREND